MFFYSADMFGPHLLCVCSATSYDPNVLSLNLNYKSHPFDSPGIRCVLVITGHRFQILCCYLIREGLIHTSQT